MDQRFPTNLVVFYLYSTQVTCLIQFSIFQAVWPHSGHYRPTEANFREFMNYLKNRNVDLTNVKVKKQIRVLYLYCYTYTILAQEHKPIYIIVHFF